MRIEESEAKVPALEAEMKAFTQAYDSDKRNQLARNIDTVEQLLNSVRGDAETAAATLKEVQSLKAEIEKLTELCVKLKRVMQTSSVK